MPKAWRVHEYGHYRDKLRWEDVDPPEAPAGGAVIKVLAAGVNFPDLLAIAGKYQVKAPLPFTPGLEACGEVIAVGDGSKLSVGQRIIASAPWGCYAEQMPVMDLSAFEVPEGMSDVEAAAMFITYQTSYFALAYRAEIQPGETLLVHGGAGGVGTAAIQLGKALGARVIATAGTDAKLEVCKRCGADELVNYKTHDFVAEVKRLTGGKGADVIYDPVGGDVFDKSSKCIAFRGRLLVIGFASGRIPEIAANRILLKNISVVGVHWGAYRTHDPDLIYTAQRKLAEHYARGDMPPVIYGDQPMKLDQLPDALAALESRDSYGKVVLAP